MTAMEAWDRSSTTGADPLIFSAALTPATRPWPAASSYPEVPLTWPAMYSPFTRFVSSVRRSWVGCTN